MNRVLAAALIAACVFAVSGCGGSEAGRRKRRNSNPPSAEGGLIFRLIVFFSLDAVGIEEVEEAVGIFFNAQLIGRPGGEWYVFLEVFDLKPVFDIYC